MKSKTKSRDKYTGKSCDIFLDYVVPDLYVIIVTDSCL